MKISRIPQISVLVLTSLLLMAGQVHAQAEDYVPTVRIQFPNIHLNEATPVPPTLNLAYLGTDPDADTAVPAFVRFLITVAEFNGQPIDTRQEYEQHYEELIDFADPNWSPWMPYPELEEQRRITYPDLPDQQHFLFAFQVMDEHGAVSLGRNYGQEVFNVQVRAEYFQPQVILNEYYLGNTSANMVTDIASGQPLNFSWIASADFYGGQIVSYRHGLDLIDPDDPNDPGWMVPPGTGEANLFAEEIILHEGYHIFTLKVVDDSGQVKVLEWQLSVIPFVPRPYQYPLLFVDQVVDDQTNQWPGEGGSPAYDREEYRNAYWQFLEGGEGVSGFDWNQDRKDHTEPVSYQDLVWYQSVLINARSHGQQLMFNELRPQNGIDRYVWLTPYQQRGGNVFLVGDRSMESFMEQLPNYMVPMVFDTNEETYVLNGNHYVVGFGQMVLPDGSDALRGPRMYPYATAGISALDWTVPLNKYVYGRSLPANQDRRSECSGVKGLVLSPDFKVAHGVGPGVVADTMMTNPLIDWRDEVSSSSDSLANSFPFYGEEFVDANISSRVTPILPQECDESPDGMCIEPMFTSLARFDWLRERKWEEGDDGWPQNQYSNARIREICGEMSQTSYVDEEISVPLATARTNGQTIGYLSYKSVEDKPAGKADVYWGFDPYRFDPTESKKAVRWVLQYFGLNINK